VLLGLLDALGDGRGHLLGLSVSDADRAVAVAHDHQGGEAEATTTLDDLGDTVDRDDPLEVRSLLDGRVTATALTAIVPAATFVVATGPAATALLTRHWSSFLELESGFAGGVRQRGDPPRVPVAAAVEDDLGHARGLGPLGEESTDLAGQSALVTLGAPHRGGERGGRDERVALEVVHDLRADVPRGPGDDEAGTLGRAADVLADPEVPTRLSDGALGGNTAAIAALEQRGGHFLPAFPALRRITSPWYLTPLPLYGSGGRIFRMFAATSPTCCLSIPLTWNRVGRSTVNVMPSGAVTTTGCEKPSANSRSVPF